MGMLGKDGKVRKWSLKEQGILLWKGSGADQEKF